MLRSRHPHDAAKPLDCVCNALVVGGHDHGVDAAGIRRAPIDMLDHRPACDLG
jgi:hypothetical protein